MARVSWLICFLKVKAKKDGSLRKNSVSTLAREVRWQKKEKKKELTLILSHRSLLPTYDKYVIC